MITPGFAEGLLVGLNLLFLVPAFLIGGIAIAAVAARMLSVFKEGQRERKRLAYHGRR